MTAERCPHCARLAHEAADLRELVHQYQAALGSEWRAPDELGLWPSEKRVLGAFVRRPYCTREMLMLALFDRDACLHQVRSVDTHIRRMRPKLRRYGVEIETVRGEGYRMPADSRARLRDWSERT